MFGRESRCDTSLLSRAEEEGGKRRAYMELAAREGGVGEPYRAPVLLSNILFADCVSGVATSLPNKAVIATNEGER